MPELPEVETVRAGIEPLLLGRTFVAVTVRNGRLRQPVTAGFTPAVTGQTILAVARRAKYLLIGCRQGTLVVHLGMSGVLRVVPAATPPLRHDHIDLLLDDGQMLRYSDPRRFGLLLWTDSDPLQHPLLAGLGPEPLSTLFDGAVLHAAAHRRRVAIKALLMDQRIVVGVGNIYASEALFLARIAPERPAATLSQAQCRRLAEAVKKTLTAAIVAGGTTLRDFHNAAGEPGYFAIELKVYGRAGEGCPRCRTAIEQRRIGQRSSYFCPHCQH